RGARAPPRRCQTFRRPWPQGVLRPPVKRQWRLSRSHGDGVETGYSGSWKGPSMSTTVLAYLILFMGFITFLAGAFGVLMLLFEEVAKTERVALRYYAMMIGLISGGLGLIGIGQGLRLLLLILGKE